MRKAGSVRAWMSGLAALGALGCGGHCIPTDAVTAASFAVDSPATTEVRVAHSAGELRARIAGRHVAFPQPRVARDDPAADEVVARAQLEAFVAATDFATSDVALVRAGGDDRMVLHGQTTRAGVTTLYYGGVCSPCAGGNPGSYYDARVADENARADRTDLVRLPKGSRVLVHLCPTECARCPTNVP